MNYFRQIRCSKFPQQTQTKEETTHASNGPGRMTCGDNLIIEGQLQTTEPLIYDPQTHHYSMAD